MRKVLSLLSLLILSVTVSNASSPSKSLTELSRLAVSNDAAEVKLAVSELRAQGPAGLQAIRETYATEITRQIANPTLKSDDEWARIAWAMDQVAQQKNSYLAGLYWYTDLQQAEAAASASGKPILSLRLLGNLTDDLSCANSRFFRTILYANPLVADKLREKFILHWQSVRPVPIISIDFGDGRKLVRTITGNSIHYVLDAKGHVIDGLPGVYGPGAFLKLLDSSLSVANQVKGLSDEQRQAILQDYFRERTNTISLAWFSDTRRIGGKLPQGYKVEFNEKGEALSIMPLAVTKSISEATILRAMTAGSEAMGQITDEPAWLKIAQLHIADSVIDPQSVVLIKHQNPDLSGAALTSLLNKLQQSVAMDTARNEYLMHSRLYAKLAADRGRASVAELNEKVYAELFMTPRSDPWLGLLMSDTYTAIDGGGVVTNER
jgi:hypothetical protein